MSWAAVKFQLPGVLQFIKGIFLAALRRADHGNVRVVMVACSVQGLSGRSEYKGYSYNMERVKSSKNRVKGGGGTQKRGRSDRVRHTKGVG